MTLYEMTNDPNQLFYIQYDGKKLQMSLRFIPTLDNWVVGIPGVVEGVAVVPNMMLLKQYGYDGIVFFSRDEHIGRDMSDTILGYLNEDEREQLKILEIAQAVRESLGEGNKIRKLGRPTP